MKLTSGIVVSKINNNVKSQHEKFESVFEFSFSPLATQMKRFSVRLEKNASDHLSLFTKTDFQQVTASSWSFVVFCFSVFIINYLLFILL